MSRDQNTCGAATALVAEGQDLLPIHAAAADLGIEVSRATALAWARRGLASVRVGRTRYTTRQALLRWLDETQPRVVRRRIP